MLAVKRHKALETLANDIQSDGVNIDVNDIELPQELAHLAQQMPDGRKILYLLKDE